MSCVKTWSRNYANFEFNILVNIYMWILQREDMWSEKHLDEYGDI